MNISEEQVSKIEEMQSEISQLQQSLQIISDALKAITDNFRAQLSAETYKQQESIFGTNDNEKN